MMIEILLNLLSRITHHASLFMYPVSGIRQPKSRIPYLASRIPDQKI
jgi:hypothetical protein